MVRSGFEQGSSSASQEASGFQRKKAVHKVNDSVFELHKPEGNPRVEIVLFHGLHLGESSDAHLSTWEAEDGSIWPQTWLIEEYPAAHVFTVSYSGRVVKTSYKKVDMYIIVENLISDLHHANIGQTPYCPVVLVGHCFGGLVIKQLCLESRNRLFNSREDKRAKAQTFLDNIRGIFYYGTPHHGIRHISSQADEHKSPLLKYFNTLSEEAGRLNYEFDDLHKVYAKWQVGGLGESRPTGSGVFQGGVAAGEGSSRQGDFFNVVEADHISISKPSSRKDRRFYSFTGLLKTIASNSQDEGRKREETVLQARPQNFQHLPEPMVNIDEEVDQITSKLETVRTLGLTGMGGLGKTTLAKAIFNKLGPSFEYTCFIEDVKLITGDVKDAMWKRIHCFGKKVGGETNFSLLNGRKLLFVFDDISDIDGKILQELAKDSGSESRFIVTSRDQDLLRSLGTNEAEVYVVPFLNENSAEVLFMKVAFASEAAPPAELKGLLKAIIKKCDGLPLALNVVGSRLRQTRDCEDWIQILNALTKAEDIKSLNERLWEKLRVSYNLLGPIEQQMFLDVCTFFGNNQNWTLYEAKLAWRAAYKTACERLLWKTLVDMSLVYNEKEDKHIKVHEQLQSLGRKIACEPNNEGKCRIWDRIEALKMLQSEEKSNEKGIRALRLFQLKENDLKDGDSYGNNTTSDNSNETDLNSAHQIQIRGTGGQNMKKAKFLEVDIHISITGVKECAPMLTILQVLLKYIGLDLLKLGLETSECASTSTNLVLLKCVGVDLLKLGLKTSLVVLKLSNVECLPKSFGDLKVLQYLVFTECSLEILPDSFGHLASLNHLEFHWCMNLETLPDSFGQLASLKHLEFHYCMKLQTLPDCFGQLASLNHLEFHNCSSLTLPDTFGQLASLNHLEFHYCLFLRPLPDSFGQLASLKHLEFQTCSSLTFPDSFGQLASLNHLEFHYCSFLRPLPDSFGQLASLKHLEFHNCSSLTLPDSFGQLASLNHLEFHNCSWLTLPDSFGQLASLNHLEFHHCSFLRPLPNSFGQLANLKHLEFHECMGLETLPNSFGQLASLKHLEFHKCMGLETLPDSFGQLASLNHLEFHDCLKLQTLLDSFGHLATLNHLEFHRCTGLETLSDSLGHLATLNHLEFHWCKILQTLPDSFGHLATLNHLEFHWCTKLQTLPDSFGQLASLKHLEFYMCMDLETLPDSFGHLATLTHLKFHKCWKLQTLPDSFGHLASLKHLEFHECTGLETLPDSFGHLATLNHLEFHWCKKLQTLPDSFGHLATLNHLEFHSCEELQTLPDFFRHLATLNHLEFHDCYHLQTLPDFVGDLPRMKHQEFLEFNNRPWYLLGSDHRLPVYIYKRRLSRPSPTPANAN